jgi:hypothetical protein
MINLYMFNHASKPTQVIIMFWACWTHGASLKVRELRVKSSIRLSTRPCAKHHIIDILISPDGSLLASMTIQSTISPFVIDDNNHSTYAPLMLHLSSCFSSLPLWHQWQKGTPFLVFLSFFSHFLLSSGSLSSILLLIIFLAPPVIMLPLCY